MEEKEIDLKDYIKLIFKRKWLILSLFLLGIIIAGALTFFTPGETKVYNGEVWLEIGKIDDNKIELSEQLINKIEDDLYGESLGGATAVNPRKTDLIQISINGFEFEKVKSILDGISGAILTEHQEKIRIKKESLENEINDLQTEIALSKQKKSDLETEIEELIAKKYVLDIDLFIRESRLDRMENRLVRKNREIKDSSYRITSLEDSLQNIQPTKILKPTTIIEKSIKFKPLLNMIIGGLSGLFLGIFLAFLKEWWQAPRRSNNYY